MIFVTNNPKETEKLAGFLLKKINNSVLKKATVIALEGELGAGKTVLVRGLAKALGIKANIKSPTFNLIKYYKAKVKVLYHLDCYRLNNHKDLEVLGIKEILKNPLNIVVIEWAERVRKILPRKHLKVHIDHIAERERKISINEN